MNQQINLYQPIFRRQKKVFSAITMVQICAFFLVVFTALYLYGQIKSQPLKDQLTRLNQDILVLNQHLARLEAQQPVEAKSKLLENEIARLSNELSKRKQVQDLLSTETMGNTKGFSGYLEAFARQHVQGNWLTKITIAKGGKNLRLEGKTLSSELVPVYMDKLSRETLLNGTSFNVMELIRPVEPSNYLDFFISTN